MPIPSDRDRAEPLGTPLLRLTPPLGDTPPAPAKLDALDDTAKLQFADPVARYSHADWERQQQAEPTCHAARRYITIGRPSALPADVLSCYPSHNQPPYTAGCGLVRRSASSPGTTGSAFFDAGLRLSPTRGGLRCYSDTVLPKGARFWCKGDDGLWWLKKISASTTEDGVSLAQNFGRSGAVQAPSFPGALHDLRGDRTRFLVPAGSRSQRVLSGGPP